MSNPSAQKPAAFRFGVFLNIKGDGLDLDEISRTLGMAPTYFSRKGERYGHAKTLCDFDAWSFSPKIERTRPLDEHIMALWDTVDPNIGYLRNLKQKFEVSVSVHLNPKSEIKMVKMWPDVGAETIWKNRSHTRSGLVRFFQNVYAQEIATDWPF